MFKLNVAIINHQCNENAILLKQGFSTVNGIVKLIDSGSQISASEKPFFDLILPNVYYAGLINAVLEFVDELANQNELLLVVCSDVKIDDPVLFIKRIKTVFEDNKVGVYGGCSNGTPHTFMKPHNTNKLRLVNFVEGFCFATRVDLIKRMKPIDLSVNYLGYGLDIYLGYLCNLAGKNNVVDDTFYVDHPRSKGYSKTKADEQKISYLNQLGICPRWYCDLALISKYQYGKSQKFFLLLTKLLGLVSLKRVGL